MPEELKKELYRIVDHFLVEAKNQNGEERSLERLNADRHLAVENIEALFAKQQEEFVKIVNRHNAILKSMIDEVKDRNGLPYCKNCGLSEENLIADIKSKLNI